MPTVAIEAAPGGLDRTRGAGVDLAFRVRGSGPAVVLLHGTSASHAVWEPIAEDLAGCATVICPDQRGHGRSDAPETGYRGPDFADDVVVLLDALGIERAIVGGHSLGARNAWLTAARHPDRVAAVLAVDYTPWVEAAVLDELAERVAGGDRDFGSVAEIEQYLAARYPLLPADAVARRAAWGYRELADGRWRTLADPAAMQQLITGLREPFQLEFESVTAPMSHLRGALSRIVGDAAWASATAARPGDRWVLDPDADHYVPEEHPSIVVSELLRLLKLSTP